MTSFAKLAKKDIFCRYIADNGLNLTHQRGIILDAFLSSDADMSSEEFYCKILAKHPRIGRTTVYRTVKLFVDSGIARPVRFADGQTRYEQCSGEGTTTTGHAPTAGIETHESRCTEHAQNV